MNLNDLDELIPRYALNKNEFDSYKKICERENAKIKQIMSKFKITNYTAKSFKASYNISTRESINEEKLLKILDGSVARDIGIIKTKEYIDYDALENAIYNNLLPNDVILEMDKAKEVKEVVTLRVSKINTKENEQ